MKDNKNQINHVYHADTRLIENIIDDKIINVTITSPPYYNLKDYGYPNQIGFGQKYKEYLDDIEKIFSYILDVTVDNGSLWMIVDSFKNSKGIVPLPFDISDRLTKKGWILQDIIIWDKGKTIPWSNKGRTKGKFEYILFFTKSKSYKYNVDRVRNFNEIKEWWKRFPERYNPNGKSPEQIWHFPIPNQGSWGKNHIRHFCPLPKDLIFRIIELSSFEGDLVFDPFSGSGMVLSQAFFMNRNYIGIELNKDYILTMDNYIKNAYEINQKKYLETFQNQAKINTQKELILSLRSIKFAKLMNKFLKSKKICVKYIIVDKNINQPPSKKHLKNEYLIVLDSNEMIDEAIVNKDLEEYISKPPLSKFGIISKFKFVKIMDSNIYNDFYCYKNKIYSFEKRFDEITESDRYLVVSKDKIKLKYNNLG